MPDAIPTPYDIADIPYIPVSPGVIEWLVFISSTALLVLFAWYRLRAPRIRRTPPSVARRVLHDVMNLSTALEDNPLVALTLKRLIAELSLSIRRSLEVPEHLAIEGKRLETMSAEELRHMLDNNPALPFNTLVRSLLMVESLKFAPEDYFSTDPSHIRAVCAALRSEVERYYRVGSEG